MTIYHSGSGGSKRVQEVVRRSVFGSTGSVASAVKEALAKIDRVERVEVDAPALSDVTDSIGEVHSGAWVASEEDPEETGFSGTVIAWPAVTINGRTYTLYGMNNGTLQFGLDALTGRALAGAGSVILDSGGITLYGDDGTNSIFSFRHVLGGNDFRFGYMWPSYLTDSNSIGITLAAYRPSSPGTVDYAQTALYTYDEYATSGRPTYVLLNSADSVRISAQHINLDSGPDNTGGGLSAEVDAGGSIDVGTYLYGWTIYDGHGETAIDWNSVIEVETTSGNQTVNLTVPTSRESTHGRRLYRTPKNAISWRRITEIADAQTTTSYQDTASNASIASNAQPPTTPTAGATRVRGSGRVTDSVGHDLVSSNPLWKPPAPTAALVNTGTGNMVNGTHRYRVRYAVVTDTEVALSAISDESNTVTVDGSHKQVTLTIPAVPGFNRYVYRTDANSDNWRALSWIGNDYATTFTDNYDDDYDNAGGQADRNWESSFGSLPGLPRYAFWLFSAMYPSTNMGSTIDTGQYMNYYTAAVTPANGDNWWHNVFLDKGDYTIKVYGQRLSSGGLLEVRIDGELITSPAFDMYGGSQVKNAFFSEDFTIDHPGFHLVQFRVNGRNVSSSGYAARISFVQIVTQNEWGQ